MANERRKITWVLLITNDVAINLENEKNVTYQLNLHKLVPRLFSTEITCGVKSKGIL